MKKLLPKFFGVLMAAFMVAVGGAVLYYSYNAVSIIFPGDLLGQLFGMMLFDLAAFVWFGAFVYLCRSTWQYVWAGFGFLIGIIGALALIAIEVFVSSGTMAAAELMKPLTYIFIGVLSGHLLLIYATHASAPEVSADISLGVETARIVEAAQDKAEQALKQNTDLLAGVMADKILARALEQMHVKLNPDQVIDLQALPILENQSASSATEGVQMPNFLSWALRGLVKGERKFESSVPSVGHPSQPLTPKPSPVADGAGLEDAEG